MYKTVRHGENSLQYRILAQQEEGLGTVKCRKSTRGKTAGVITVILLLVCGIIATAVLVPLVLTNDFITLTGTFQKFSVSTLRRSHSGNHVVVIAKKPHGWNSSHQSGVLSAPVKVSNATNHHGTNKTKVSTPSPEPPTTIHTIRIESATTQTTTTTTTSTTTRLASDIEVTSSLVRKTTETTPQNRMLTPATTPKTTARTAAQNVEPETKITAKSSPISNRPETPSLMGLPSPTQVPPAWYQHRKWTFETPASFISWSKNRMSSNPLSTAVGGICAVAVIIIMIIVLMKSLPGRRRFVQKETAESKEDKARLLKPSARTSDEE